jgi:hypothetical protein
VGIRLASVCGLWKHISVQFGRGAGEGDRITQKKGMGEVEWGLFSWHFDFMLLDIYSGNYDLRVLENRKTL